MTELQEKHLTMLRIQIKVLFSIFANEISYSYKFETCLLENNRNYIFSLGIHWSKS